MLTRFFIKVLNKLKLLRFLNLVTTLSVGQKKIKVPLHGSLGYSNYNLTETWMTQTLRQLKPLFKGAFVDVGVNTGQTLIKVYSLFDNVHYTGFEPNAVCVHYVQNLIKVNRFANCNLLPIGLSSNAGVLKLNFYYDEETDQSASIVEQFRPDQPINHYAYVPVFNSNGIRSFLPSQQHAILKVDVEGAELEVLKGLQDWVVAHQPLILVEILPVYNVDNHFRLQRQREIESMLQAWNYRIGRLIKGQTISLKQLDTIEVHGDIELCDYIMYPASLSAQVLNCFGEKQPA